VNIWKFSIDHLAGAIMRIFPPALEIGDHEGFDPQKDIFQRAAFGAGIANLLGTSSDPLIVMLDAPWGTGKTTFIKMLAGHLRNEGFPVIYFDAFENDHVDNGFLTIAGEVIRLSRDLKKDKTSQHKRFVKKAARAGGILLRMGAKIGVKAATLGAIDAADFEGLKSVAGDIANVTSTKADEYVESLLKLQSQEHETLNEVRSALGELAKSLVNSKADGNNPKARPLIFIIDELDRCRPTFALELLEKIKHIFSIPNVHFVLSTHLAQLENTVKFSYGSDVDARTYLQKFYNVLLSFPEEKKQLSERVIPKYFSYLSRTLSIKSDDLALVRNVAEAKQLPLRTIERIVTCIALARTFTPKNYLWLDPIISGLSIVKIIEPSLFRSLQRGDAALDQVATLFAVKDWPSDDPLPWMMEWWTYCLAKNESDYPKLDWQGFRQSLARYGTVDREDIVRFMSDHLTRLQPP
jgi:KAP family P-loop domain